jgi:hypothetical protein
MAKHASKAGTKANLDPLQAIPIVPNATRSEPLTSRQGLLLFRTDQPQGHIFGWLARLGWKRERIFELDAVGACFYHEVDGRRSLIEIQETLVTTFGFDEHTARKAVVAYTSQLMRRGLLVLKVEPNPESARDYG